MPSVSDRLSCTHSTRECVNGAEPVRSDGCSDSRSSGCSALPSGEAADTTRAADAGSRPARRAVDKARIVAADPAEWVTHGRTYDEQRYSPLDRIDEANVAELGLAWSFDLETTHGVEATPLVVDDVMYVTRPGASSTPSTRDRREALAIRSGGPARPCAQALLRRRQSRCRLWDDRIFVGTLDGRLIALDRATGKPRLVDLDRRSAAATTRSPARPASSRATS